MTPLCSKPFTGFHLWIKAKSSDWAIQPVPIQSDLAFLHSCLSHSTLNLPECSCLRAFYADALTLHSSTDLPPGFALKWASQGSLSWLSSLKFTIQTSATHFFQLFSFIFPIKLTSPKILFYISFLIS